MPGSRPVPLARLERQRTLQARLAAALGDSSGAVLHAATEADAEGVTSAELWLYGVVGSYWWGFSDKTVADQLRGLNVDTITVRINSPGGDSIQGIAIGNLLRNHKAEVTVVVDGLAASAASIIAVAGDRVVMSPGSQMMIHDPWFFTMGNAKELRQDADFLDKQGANMAGVYAHEAGGTPESWRTAMTADPDGTWYSADEAVTAKLADEVGTIVAVSAAPEPPPVDLEDDTEASARAAFDLEVLITPAARAAWGSYCSAAAGLGPKTPESTPAPGPATPTQEGGAAVAEISDEQLTIMRQQLGVAADADLATCLAAMKEALDEQAEDTGSPAPAAITPPAAPSGLPDLPAGVVVIDASVLEGLQAGAKTAAELAERDRVSTRDAAITAAFRAGKITANSKAEWVKSWDANPAQAQALLDVMPAGMIPVDEVGHDQTTLDASTGTQAENKELAGIFGLSEEVYA